jgi:hypothetical protein
VKTLIARVAAALMFALACAAVAPQARAANCASLPYALTNGTTADATQVMANFNSLQTCANGQLAHNGANADITALSALSTPITVLQGGTGSSTAAGARTNLGGTATGVAVFTAASQAAARSALALDTADSPTFAAVTATTFTGALTGNATNVTGTVAVANGGTGATTAAAARNALLPSQTGASGKALRSDGTNAAWAGYPATAFAFYTDVAGTFTQQFANGVTLARTATGQYTLTLSSAASCAACWGFVVLGGQGGGNGAIVTELYSGNRTASSAKFETRNIAGSSTNSESVFVLVFAN